MLAISRSEAMSAEWSLHWGSAQPVSHQLKHELSDRWVRFHSLPGSKRYPESGPEWREVLARHRILIEDLRSSSRGQNILVVAQDYPKSDRFHGWTEKALPGSWLWKTLEPLEPGDDPSYIRISTPFTSPNDLDALIRMIAADEGEVGSCIVTDDSLGWLYAPY